MHSLSPRVIAEASPDQIAEIRRANAAEEAFLSRYGLKRYACTALQVRRVLSTGHARGDPVTDVLEKYFLGGYTVPIDHGLLYGRDRKAVVMIGHPYPLCGEDPPGPYGLQMLAAVRALGVETCVEPPSESFYGFGTWQVRIGKLPRAVLPLRVAP